MYHHQSHNNDGTPPLQLSATFTPGMDDNYHLPVISPIPQRSMPEVPEQMQQNLAKLELGPGGASPAPVQQGRMGGYRGASSEHEHNASHPPNQYLAHGGLQEPPRASPQASPRVSPNVSPRPVPNTFAQAPVSAEAFFPYIKKPPPNIPARAEETERTLEAARHAVLTSNDPEMQITWAQDTLTYVDSAIENNARLAEAGLGRSQTPRIEHQLKVDAANIVSFLADQHHPRAEFLKGTWLEFGKFGYEIDKPQAYRCFATSARNGYGRSEYRMGMQFEETGEIDKALKHYHLGLQAHDAASYYRMGMMYLLGQQGQPQDLQRGVDYIKYSADNADENAPQGAYVYGMLLARELPQVTMSEAVLPKNLALAKYFLEKAAYLGFSKAQVRIASAYELQQFGCEFDPVYSLHYNQLAARQGESEAEMAISKWFLSGYEGVFPKNEAVAYEYALRAAKAGFPTAEFAMGYFSEVGIHVPPNLTDAKYWYGKAAEHGNQDASGRISGISRSKTLSRKDHDNMALAKIKSVRGRPNNEASKSSLEMPQVDSYRQPSPNPGQMQSPQITTTNPNGTMSYQQGPQNHFASSSFVGRPSPAPPIASTGPHAYQQQQFRPVSAVQGQEPTVSASPVVGLTSNLRPPVSASPSAAPYSGRQSSLPQGYRMSSNTLPTGPAPIRMNQPNVTRPALSEYSTSQQPTSQQPSYPVDIGYSAPNDFGRRIASGPGALSNSQPTVRPAAGLPNRKPAPVTARPQISQQQQQQQQPRPPRSESLQAKPTHISSSDYSNARPPNTSHTNSATPKPPAKAPTSSGAPSSSTAPPQAGRKPGKGPATFAEMGIPAAKQDSDCLVM